MFYIVVEADNFHISKGNSPKIKLVWKGSQKYIDLFEFSMKNCVLRQQFFFLQNSQDTVDHTPAGTGNYFSHGSLSKKFFVEFKSESLKNKKVSKFQQL